MIYQYDILSLRIFLKERKNPKIYEITQAHWFKDRKSTELLYIASYKALDCLLGNKCFCFS